MGKYKQIGYGPRVANEDAQNERKRLVAIGAPGNENRITAPGFRPKEQMEMSTMSTSGEQTQAPETDGGYVPSDTVQQAQALLQEHMANKPGEYGSQYAGQIQQILDRILNREDFSYDLNGDALYKQYADQYTRQGKLAMMDTMGQAAALTGGYGNSYAQSVGQQAYQGYLQQLNAVVPELYGMALDRYNQEGEQLLNQYGVLTSQDEQAYGRYRDQVADYYTELQRLTEDARYAAEDEYGKYIDERNYQYQQGRDAVEDDQWERSFQYQQERDSVADQQWAKEFAEAQRQYNESKKSSAGGSSGSNKSYEMSASEYEKWKGMWATVESEADADALADGMAAAGVPYELIAVWYDHYSGLYEKDGEPTDTTVPGEENIYWPGEGFNGAKEPFKRVPFG